MVEDKEMNESIDVSTMVVDATWQKIPNETPAISQDLPDSFGHPGAFLATTEQVSLAVLLARVRKQ